MQLSKIKIPKKYLKIGAWIIGVFLIVCMALGVVAYNKREALLKKMVAKAITKANKDFGLDVKIGAATFDGLSTVKMTGITVVPKDRDTLASINELSVGVKLLPLIFGTVKLSQVKLNQGFVNIVLKDSTTNIDFILKRKKKDSTENKNKVNLADIASNVMNEVLYKIPDDMDVKNMRFKFNDNDTAKLTFDTQAIINNGDLTSTINVNNRESIWHIDGYVNPGSKKLSFTVYADGKKLELPYLNQKLHAKLSFDTLQTELKNAKYSGDDYKISGSWSVKNMLINQPRIASNDIIVQSAKLDADVLIGPNFISLDSTSTAYLKNATIHPFVKYTLGKNKIYELKLRAEEQDAQSIFDAFPQGLFESLEGLKVKGKVKYDLNFYLDTKIPDSVRFNSTLTPVDFKIVQWGKTNLQKINSAFVYTPYEYGKPMRDITIGPANANFTPLGSISKNFVNSVLTAEDPSFFTHNGFVEESIRKSIAINYKEKKFKRGGSTISMQLVKNIYLSRQKTLARKAEEILIVWLIEHNHLVTKQRMLEVYFNIIELGQNIYGIGEASRYYFGKQPADLTIGEGIFLASIVPRPKAAMYKFVADGSLKPYMYNYFRFMGNIMAKRGFATADSTNYGFYNVRLREGLRRYLAPDSAAVDTVLVDEDGEAMPVVMQDKSKNLFDRIFGPSKTDSVSKRNNNMPADTTKTNKQLRQERREQRRLEREKVVGG
ncbi:penicillin-binding protein [Pedobacter changchengzhani]|uniref:Penicillin-binding protein n=1 Tax=Pedobacter changchengzhani TaxID=2529274 RepID=A0A4R5MNT5_9SPHI|nr:biosynthetic peptidoglycan transglycosylase [Pedobacter changchengzhani]TDG37348.1 penicillin-binding protein [Pedobacter changchengzhani]